jgi:hypothetical protein
VCLIDWGSGKPSLAPGSSDLKQSAILKGAATLTLAQEQLSSRKFEKRLVELSGNDLVLPLPPVVKDSVGADIDDIPRALKAITESMDGENAMPAYCFGKELLRRIRAYGSGTHDGTVDILVTGCEVSLWLAEQWASDMHLLFPLLNIKVISSNKLLGLQGQDVSGPQIGFQYHEESWTLENTIAIVVSHSGGTFGPLAVSNLLQGYTKNLFVITSEWDTQIGKQVCLSLSQILAAVASPSSPPAPPPHTHECLAARTPACPCVLLHACGRTSQVPGNWMLEKLGGQTDET